MASAQQSTAQTEEIRNILNPIIIGMDRIGYIRNNINDIRKIEGRRTFKSGQYKGITFDQLLKNKETREKVVSSKSPAYRGINAYYWYLKEQSKELNRLTRQQRQIENKQIEESK